MPKTAKETRDWYIRSRGLIDIRPLAEQSQEAAQAAALSRPTQGASAQAAPAMGIPAEYKGGALGPNGEKLPYGAISYNSRGEAYYGDGLAGYMKGVVSRISAPIEKQEGGTEQLKYDFKFPSPFDFSSEAMQSRRENMQWAGKLLSSGVHNWENLPLGMSYVTRTVDEVVRGTLSLFNEAAIKTEQVGGTAVGLVRGEKLDEAWNASRIAYSTLVHSGLRDEYLRRYRNGENPYLLATELEDPLPELVGQLILDPLNIIAFGGGILSKLRKAGRTTVYLDDTSELVKAAKGFLEAGKITDPVERAAEVAKFLPTIRAASRAEKAALATYAAKTGLSVLTSSGKASVIADGTNIVFHALITGARDVDEVRDMVVAWAKVTSGAEDDAQLAEAVARLAKNKGIWQVVASPLGMKTGQVVGDMFLAADGTLDAAKLSEFDKVIDAARAADAAEPGKGIQALAEWFLKKGDDTAAQMFPSIMDRIENQGIIAKLQEAGQAIPRNLERFIGDKIPASTQKLAEVDRILRGQKGPVAIINKFFGSIYMGMSPGYAFRNLLTNSVHMFVDYGPKVFHNPKTALAELEAWGAVNRQALVGFKGPASGAEVGKSGIFNYFLTKSGEFERNAAVQVSRHAFLDTMRKMWKRGRVLPEVDDLMRAGFAEDDIRRLEQLTWAAHGDGQQAIKMFFGEGGARRTLLHLSEEQLNALDSIPGARTALEDAIRVAKNKDDAVAGVENARDLLRRAVRDGKAQEFIPEEGTEAYNALKEVNDIGAPQNAAQDLLGKRVALQQAARDSMRGAAQRLQTLIARQLERGGLPDKAQAVVDVYGRANVGVDDIISAARKAHQDALRAVRETKNWDEWVAPGGIRDGIWNKVEDDVNALMNGAVDEMLKASGMSGIDTAEIVKAQAAYEESLLWRNADLELYKQTGSVYIRDARGIAMKYGIPTAMPSGTPADAHALNAINANLPEGTQPFKSLNDVPPDVAEAAMRLREGGKIPSAAEAARIVDSAENLAKEGKWPEAFAEWRKVTGAPDGKVAVYRRTSELLDKPGNWWTFNPFSQREGKIVEWGHVTEAEAMRLNEAAKLENERLGHAGWEWSSAFVGDTGVKIVPNPAEVHPRGGVPGSMEASAYRESLLERASALKTASGVGQEADEAADSLRVASESAHGPARLGPVGSDGMNPTRALSEQEAGYENLFDQIAQSTGDNWERIATTPSKATPAQEEALRKWLAILDERLPVAKATGMAVADGARQFTLLDYNQKKGWNVALGYLMPYHFWYSGTYRNWITRAVINPGAIAAYAKYRHYLEKIHAGMPDWWKYSINSNELLGMNSENPLFFNLEATINPLNGITGVDFTDPDRQKSWFAGVMDGLSKFGPSVWTPLMLGAAGLMWMKGQKEEAGAVAGRLIPQTATIKAATSILGVPGGVELDPLVQLMQGGIDKYERRRIGRALGEMVESGEIDQATAVDAARTQTGVVWERAASLAMEKRQWGQLASFAFGVGFKSRNITDMQIDRMYSEMFALTGRKADLSPQEYRGMWDNLEQRYPFMDTVLLSRKGTRERDEALAWSVLGRIPPGQSSDYAALAGISASLIDQFYADKGSTEDWSEADKLSLMGGIVALGAVLGVPDGTTQREWNAARAAYSSMLAQIPEATQRKIDLYYSYKDDRQKADMFLRANPEVEQALDWKAQQVMNNPSLFRFYGGIEFVEGFYKSQMYKEAEKKFGADIQTTNEHYWAIRDKDGNYKAYLRDHPELKQYWDFLDSYKAKIAQQLIAIEGKLPETPQPFIRANAEKAGAVAQDILAGMAEMGVAEVDPEIAAYMTDVKSKSLGGGVDIQAWLASMPPYYSRLIEDYLYRGQPMPPALADQLSGMGINLSTLQ